MKVISALEKLSEAIAEARSNSLIIGFVPTMGALHQGHMALIQRARKECDLVVSSIFVNPTQFNNASDLNLYPRTPEADTHLLESNGCDLAFFPSVDSIYPTDYTPIQLDLGKLDRVMEGEFRPGHFQGVVQVVHRLFELVQPDKAYFGLKDFQQVAVIQFMVQSFQLPVEIVPCPTLREQTGLAMSSRNIRLSEQGKEQALVIYNSLEGAKQLTPNQTPNEVKQWITQQFEGSSLALEYISIVHPRTLEPLESDWVSGATACLAAFCEDVRLIDNMVLVAD